MISLDKIECKQFALGSINFIGVLLFAELPSTIVYSDKIKNVIIREWVDCSEDGQVDRYFYFKSNPYLLKSFLEGHISHYDLIKKAVDGLAYFQDITQNGIDSNYILSINKLPKEYSSSSDFFLKRDDIPDFELIHNYFELGSVNEYLNSHENDIKDIATARHTETLNIHLKNGNGVSHGTVNTEILGKTLLRFDRFYKNVALDYYEGLDRGSIKLNSISKSELGHNISTEVYGNLAASYSILLRPKNTQFQLFDESSPAEQIYQKIFILIENSLDLRQLENEYSSHSDFTINTYKDFLKSIYESQLDIDINWFSPISKKSFTTKLDYKAANKSLYNIENLNVTNEEKFSKKGKFRSLNCDTGHYTFISTDQEQFSGYFDRLVKEGSEQINFISIYEIVVVRQTIKELGRLDAKIVDTVVAFFKEEED